MAKKDIPGRKESVKTARSIINNLNSASDDLMDAKEAKYLLSALHNRVGETQQNMIIKCVLYAVRNHPDYSGHYGELHEAFVGAGKEQ